MRGFTLTPALSLKGEGVWVPAFAGMTGVGVSFDKLRTNDLLVYLLLIAQGGGGLDCFVSRFAGAPRVREWRVEGIRDGVSFDRLRTNDLLVYLPLIAQGGGGLDCFVSRLVDSRVRGNDGWELQCALTSYIPDVTLTETVISITVCMRMKMGNGAR